MAINTTIKDENRFIAVSAVAKKQTAFGTPLDDASLDTRENCTVQISYVTEYGEELSCDRRDLVGEPLKSWFLRFRLTFDRFNPAQMFRYKSYMLGATTAPTGTPANQVQTLTRGGTVSGGTFKIAWTVEGRTGTTKPIAFDASNAAILAAIIASNYFGALGELIKSGDVAVTGSWGTAISLTFGGRLAKANLPALTIDGTGLTGTAPVIAVAIATPGANKFHTATRSADGTKPLFSIATGEINERIATRKYSDCVVESIEDNVSADNPTASMVVSILCPVGSEELVAFDIPDCVNFIAVKAEDVRVSFDGVEEIENLVSHAISLNDNVPTDSAFRFYSPNPSEAFESGTRPTQEVTSEIFGTDEHPLYVLAKDVATYNNEIAVNTRFGHLGNRCSVLMPETKIKPQGELDGRTTTVNKSTVKITGTPYGITGKPYSVTAMLDETEMFLQEES